MASSLCEELANLNLPFHTAFKPTTIGTLLCLELEYSLVAVTTEHLLITREASFKLSTVYGVSSKKKKNDCTETKNSRK